MSAKLRHGSFDGRLRFRFRHASASRTATENVIVELRDSEGHCGYGEGCPRVYVTGETSKSATDFIVRLGADFAAVATDITRIERWAEVHSSKIDENPAAYAALELAALDLIGQREGRPIEALLEARPLDAPVTYSAILGNASAVATRLAVAGYRLAGFSDFKIKLSGDTAWDKRRLAYLPPGASVRADANNLWLDADAAIAGLRALDFGFTAIEEPVKAGDVDGMRAVAVALDIPVILDESLVRLDQLSAFTEDPQRWIANIRVSKCGGVRRSIELARTSQFAGLSVVLGAHVGETSILTRAALAVGGALLRPPLAREGGFGTILLVSDVAAPALRFARGGRLDPAFWGLNTAPGLGLTMRLDKMRWQA